MFNTTPVHHQELRPERTRPYLLSVNFDPFIAISFHYHFRLIFQSAQYVLLIPEKIMKSKTADPKRKF